MTDICTRIETLIDILKLNKKTLKLLKQLPEETQLELLEGFYDFALKNEVVKQLLGIMGE